MIRNLLATTAIATLVATGAVAQTTAPTTTDPMAAPAEQVPMVIRAEGHLASELIGESVYNGTGEGAENIGRVTDLVIDNDGNVEAIVVGVGGFLGIGQKEVALQYDLVQWSEQQDSGDRWLIVETTEDALRAQQDFDRSAYRPMPADADVAETRPATAEDLAAAPAPDADADVTAEAPADDAMTTDDTAAAPADQDTDMATDTAEAPADDTMPADETAAAPADDRADETVAAAPATDDATTDETAQADQPIVETDETQTGAIDRNAMQEVTQDQMRAEDLTGTTVYGANEENIGQIGDVILTPDGQVDAIIVDVGGFLGIGAKEVAIGMDNLVFMRDENGDLYLFTEFTQEQLEAQPEYDEATYAEQRDEMRMRVQ
jgi:sporulation protein YlmC with PRC-barrel domain